MKPIDLHKTLNHTYSNILKWEYSCSYQWIQSIAQKEEKAKSINTMVYHYVVETSIADVKVDPRPYKIEIKIYKKV